MSANFNFLAKYDGEAFKAGVIKVLNVLHNNHIKAQESNTKRIAQMEKARKKALETAEMVLKVNEELRTELEELKGKHQALVDELRGGPSH